MLGLKKKRKTGTQIAQELGDNLARKVKDMSKRDMPLKIICTFCMVILSVSLGFGFHGLASRLSDISEKEENVRKLQTELKMLNEQFEASMEQKQKLVNDTLTIEAVARSHGMSKKGERVFYFVD
ncbi:MAG: septum formation initiator family protein [Fibromonadaceae bacterium]|jgi:cell division protein FtsB|nr:septum formation initiator family protein [Fibromonadaceae bacterium]